MTHLEITPVPESDKPALWGMLQTYIAGMTAYVDVKSANGVYSYENFDKYWADDDRFPFWAIYSGERVGFALVWNDRDHDIFRMSEFYVRPESRRLNLGTAFARDVIERFPGRWKIRQIARNAPAVAFWRRTLAIYSYTETDFEDRGLARWEQSFVIRPM
jgi:predicted acetyltransferase